MDTDLKRFCLDSRIDVLVSRRLTSFDLVPVVTPHDVDADRVMRVTAAIADGPHSEFAAAVAARIAARLGVPGELATAYRDDEEYLMARRRLGRFGGQHPTLGQRAIEASSARTLLNGLAPKTLLVLGAPGGSWLQRQLLGPGHRLKVSAPSGAVVVRSAPRRAFQVAMDAAGAAVGPHLPLGEARRLYAMRTLPVAEGGKLVGIVRLDDVLDVPGTVEVGDVMEPPDAVTVDQPLDALREASELIDGDVIPVVDDDLRLFGTIAAPGDLPPP